MLKLPLTTEVKRSHPNSGLYERLDWKLSQPESIDADVSRLDFVNWIAPHTHPAIAVGMEVKEIFVFEVSLKTRDFDTKVIVLLAKNIPPNIVYVLCYGNEDILATYHTKLYTYPWLGVDDITLSLSGINLEATWKTLCTQSVSSRLMRIDPSSIKSRLKKNVSG